MTDSRRRPIGYERRLEERRRRASERGGKKPWMRILMVGLAFCLILSCSAACIYGCFHKKEVSGSSINDNVTQVNATTRKQDSNSGAKHINSDETLVEKPAPLTDRSEIIMEKTNFIVSYNTDTFCPNYVAWHLTKDRVNGDVSRTNNFHPDETLPFEFQVMPSDYSNSGYDRGHMCPAADNKDSYEHMRNSFLMTNICPQNRNLNAGDWNDLEVQCRSWVNKYDDLYIVCGPIFNEGIPLTIGKPDRMQIVVPDAFFKVVLVMGQKPKAIGFMYPNASGHRKIKDYAVSVDEVENRTGIDFYYSLPDDTEEEIEFECNPASWGL